MESRVFSAEEGLAMGFVSAIVPEAEWLAALDRSVQRAERLDWDSNRFLLNYTMEDTRAADMAALVETCTRPGLKERILEYQRSEKAARGR
jgi:enoyl-CoA hydratase/carnithine racemase